MHTMLHNFVQLSFARFLFLSILRHKDSRFSVGGKEFFNTALVSLRAHWSTRD